MKTNNLFDLKNYLLQTKKKIFIYGTGRNAIKTFNLCHKFKIVIYGFVVSNLKIHHFMNKNVYKIENILDNNIIILLTFSAKKNDDINYLLKLNNKYEIYCLYTSPFDNILFDQNYFHQNRKKIIAVYNMLYDDLSKKTFINLIKFRITGQIKYLFHIFSDKINDKIELLKLNTKEIFVDIGAYNGDTIKEFIYLTNNIFKKIYAFECDKKNFLKLNKYINYINNKNNILIFNIAVSNRKYKEIISGEASMNTHIINSKNKIDHFKFKKYYKIQSNKLDNIISNFVTYIKYDVEGAELIALKGSKKMIINYTPKLCISIYHKNNDIFDIPIFIKNQSQKYYFYIRQISHIPCWDTVLYCIPKIKRYNSIE